MLRIINDLIRKLRYPFLLIVKKVKISYSSSVSKNVYFEGQNIIGKKCVIRNSSFGFGTYLGDNCIIANCKVGKYCSIAYGLKILVGKHPTKKIVSTHPAFFSLLKQGGFTYTDKQLFEEIDYVDKDKEICVQIGSDVWIGTDVKINNGVSIGNGAVIGAGSLVLNDVKPYEIVAGVPAKKIGERFSSDEQKILLDFKWWDKDRKWIQSHAKLFSNIDDMKEWIKKHGK